MALRRAIGLTLFFCYLSAQAIGKLESLRNYSQSSESAEQGKVFYITGRPGSDVNPKDIFTYNVYFGNMFLGQSRTITVIWRNDSDTNKAVLGSLSKSGSSDFSYANNTCDGRTLFPGQSCSYNMTFAPTAKSILTATVTFPITWYLSNGNFLRNDTDFDIFYGAGFDRPPDCDSKSGGSIISVDNRSLGEVVPILGVDFGLYYSSIYASEYSSSLFKLPVSPYFDDGGWKVGVHHFYDQSQSRLFLGTGQVVEKYPYTQTDGTILIPSNDGSEVYVFTAEGLHLRTLTGLTGALKYTFDYDSQKRLIMITDSYNNQTILTRNASEQIIRISSPYGQITKLAYYSTGRLRTVTNANNNETYTLTYKNINGTQSGLLETFKKPGGQVSTFYYDAGGKLTKDLGNGGNFWQLFESNGTLTKTSALSRASTYGVGYNQFGDHTRIETEPTGFSNSTSEYKDGSFLSLNSIQSTFHSTTNDERFGPSLRRLAAYLVEIGTTDSETDYGQTVVYPNGVTQEPFNYSTLIKTQTRGSDQHVDAFDKGSLQRVLTTAAGAKVTTVYNSLEQMTSSQIGSDTAVSLSYDTRGRLQQTIQGTKNKKVYAYNGVGLLKSVTDALNKKTSYGYDLSNRLHTVTLPDLRIIQYDHDPNGNLTGVTPPSRPIHQFALNAYELVEDYEPPVLSGVAVVNTHYDYNLDKQLTQITRPTGDLVTYSYDSTTGLLGDITLPKGVNHLSYYSNSDQVRQIDSVDGVRTQYAYYGYQVSSETQKKSSTDFLVGQVSTTFDGYHRPQTITIQGNALTPNWQFTTVYNGDDKPTQIGNMTLTYEYPSGRPSTTVLGKIHDLKTYDIYGNLKTYKAYYKPTSGATQTLYSYTLTRDSLFRIQTKTETIQGVTDTYEYTYDDVGRLKTVTKNGLAYSAYDYDDNSNRTGTLSAGVTFSSTFDNQDRIQNYNSITYGFNANGDQTLVSYPGTGNQQNTFDALGNLKSIQQTSGSVVNFSYDGKNRVVSRSVNGVVKARYIYQNDYQIAAQASDTGVVSKVFLYGTHVNTPDAMQVGSTWYRIITDNLGSVRLVVKTTDGTVMQRMDYSDLGKVLSDTNPGYQPYGFAGGIYFGNEGVVKFGARYYDPSTGRWLSKDPILFNGGDTNLYGYVLNDPINIVDPKGEFGWILAAGAVSAALNAYETYKACGSIRKIAISALTGFGLGVVGGAAATYGIVAGTVAGFATGLGNSFAQQLINNNGNVDYGIAVGQGISEGVGGGLGTAGTNVANRVFTEGVSEAFGFALGTGVAQGLSQNNPSCGCPK